jgi:hypothetical protein
MSDPYLGWHDFARIELRQGDAEIIVPVYKDMQTVDGLEKLGQYMDRLMLAETGMVLPTRTWRMLTG